MGGVRNFIFKKVQVAAKLKEFETPIADAFIVHHQVLNQLPSTFHQRKVNLHHSEGKMEYILAFYLCLGTDQT